MGGSFFCSKHRGWKSGAKFGILKSFTERTESLEAMEIKKVKPRKMSKKYKKMPINRKADLPRRVLLFSACLLILALLCLGVYLVMDKWGPQILQPETSSIPEVVSSKSPPAPSSSEPEPVTSAVPEPVSITILGAGDNLIHSTLYKQAYQRTGGKGYDFKPVYENVKPLVQAADLAVINQETILAGKIFAPSNYPLFNSPTEVGDALVDMGFDVVNHANNHVLDKGVKGVNAAMEYWATQPSITVTGVYQGEEDMENIRIVETDGIKTAFVGITESTNGLVMPESSPYRLLMASDRETIKTVLQKAKSLADVVVVTAHWGNEDAFAVSEGQKKLAQDMVNWGADIIFGSHPHVLQELAVLTREDGTQCPVIYSLGNFASAQNKAKNMVSGLLSVTVTKDFTTNQTTYTSMKFQPTVTHYDYGYLNNRIYPLNEYTKELASKHGVRQFDRSFTLDYAQDIVNQQIPAEFLAKD